jgi:hypothetical protein
MDNLEKFGKALFILKTGTQYSVSNKVETEEDFNNNIKWVTGVTEDNTAIITSVCPHSEITWDLVKTEMDKLQAEYDAQDYARKRKVEYPDIYDYIDGVVKSDQAQIDKYIADCQAVKDKYSKGA